MDVADLPAGGLEEGIAIVPANRHQIGQRWGQAVDRVVGQVRVGDVALHALDGELAAHGAASSVFDHVTGLLHRCGFAHDAKLRRITTCLERFAHHHGAVEGWAFFVAGQQKCDAKLRLGAACKKLLHSHHHGRQRCFHVARAAPKQLAVFVGGGERVTVPLRQWPGGHHIGVPGKGQSLARSACTFGPKVTHAEGVRAGIHEFTDKAQRLQGVGYQFQTAGILWRDRGFGDQLFGQAQGVVTGVGHGLEGMRGWMPGQARHDSGVG